MSIITDALRKAERERGLRYKRTSEEAAAIVTGEEVKPATETFVEQANLMEMDVAETIARAQAQSESKVVRETTFFAPAWFSSKRFQEVLISAATVFICLAALSLFSHRRAIGKNLLFLWHPFQITKMFQPAPQTVVYNQNVSKGV